MIYLLSLLSLDLFSSFDSYSFLFSNDLLVYFSGILLMFNLLLMYSWVHGGFSFMLVLDKLMSDILHSKFKFFGCFLLYSSILLFLVFVNLLGMVPGGFSFSSQVTSVLGLSLFLWLTVVASSLFYNPVSFFGHFTPQGSPSALVFLLNLVETVSNVIRFMTLSLRLSMKMTTGHVLLGLLSICGVGSFFSLGFFVVILLFVGYLMFEMGVCLVQGFVFFLLNSEYLGEHSE